MILPAGLLGLAAAGAAPRLDLDALGACPKQSSGEIVVCGSRDRQSRYRLPQLPRTYDSKPLRAETDIRGTQARAHVESNVRPDGLVDKRIMVTFSWPF